ncbi:hypothetical protein U1Q18_046676 [Sarracenia purpurea var. burkii]
MNYHVCLRDLGRNQGDFAGRSSVRPAFGFCSEIHVEIKGFGVVAEEEEGCDAGGNKGSDEEEELQSSRIAEGNEIVFGQLSRVSHEERSSGFGNLLNHVCNPEVSRIYRLKREEEGPGNYSVCALGSQRKVDQSSAHDFRDFLGISISAIRICIRKEIKGFVLQILGFTESGCLSRNLVWQHMYCNLQ